MKRERILAKVKKLLSLSADKSNVNESMAAASMAQKLIEEHRIKQAELDETVSRTLLEFELLEEDDHKPQMWKVHLANYLSRVNGCTCIYMRGVKNVTKSKIMLFGYQDNLNIVIYMFWYLSTAIDKHAKKEGKGKGQKWMNSFRMGAVVTINRRFQNAKEEARRKMRDEAQNSSSTTALVRVENAITKLDAELSDAISFMTNKYRLEAARGKGVRCNAEGYSAGQKMANNLLLDPKKKRKLHSSPTQLKRT